MIPNSFYKKNKKNITRKRHKSAVLASAVLLAVAPIFAPPALAVGIKATGISKQFKTDAIKVIAAKKINPTTIELSLSDGQTLTLDFYGENIFRLFEDHNGGFIRDPQAKPEAKILVENPRRPVSKLNVTDENNQISITTDKISVQVDKNTSLIKIINLATKAVVMEETAPVQFEKGKVTLTLKENTAEYFYGGGVQNGRFSHKGKSIAIENQNSWTDGGVA